MKRAKKIHYSHKASGFGFDRIRTNVTECKSVPELVNNLLLQIDPHFFDNQKKTKK